MRVTRRTMHDAMKARAEKRIERRRQPHDLRPGESFDPECIYIHDSGRVACGRHVGTEATYMPQAWSCLGLGSTFPHNGITFACETCYPRGYRPSEATLQDRCVACGMYERDCCCADANRE